MPVPDIWVEADRRRDRHARPRLLHPRRRRAAAAVRRAGHHRDQRVSVQAGRRDALGVPGEDHLLAEEAGAEGDARDSRRQGQVVRTFNGAAPGAGRGGRGGRGAQGAQAAPGAAADAPAESERGSAGRRRRRRRARTRRSADDPMAAGVKRFTWDLQYAPVTPFPGMMLWGATTNGPLALPGTLSGAADRRRPGRSRSRSP